MSKILQRIRNKVVLTSIPDRGLTHIECQNCHYQAYIHCIMSICSAVEKKNDHLKDIWYQEVKRIMVTKVNPSKCIGHFCEVRKKIEACKINQHEDLPMEKSTIRYDGYLHLPRLYIYCSLHRQNNMLIYTDLGRNTNKTR